MVNTKNKIPKFWTIWQLDEESDRDDENQISVVSSDEESSSSVQDYDLAKIDEPIVAEKAAETKSSVVLFQNDQVSEAFIM